MTDEKKLPDVDFADMEKRVMSLLGIDPSFAGLLGTRTGRWPSGGSIPRSNSSAHEAGGEVVFSGKLSNYLAQLEHAARETPRFPHDEVFISVKNDGTATIDWETRMSSMPDWAIDRKED